MERDVPERWASQRRPAGIESGLKVEDDDAETAKYKALAAFSQAGSLTGLALEFDKAFVVDESTDAVATPPELVPYTEVAVAAVPNGTPSSLR